MLNSKYQNVEVYDFEDNLQLWIDYIGDPSRDYPPIDVSINNRTSSSFLLQVYKDGVCKYDDLINGHCILQFPMFVDEEYELKIIDITSGKQLEMMTICPSFEQREYEIEGNFDEEDIRRSCKYNYRTLCGYQFCWKNVELFKYTIESDRY